MNRIGVYVFYDKRGIVEEYVIYLLEKMSPFFSKMICISNGQLKDAEKDKLDPYFDKIIERDNKGYDVSAYKEGYFLLRDQLQDYDELLFFNGTFYGPVLPLKPMFETMEKEDVDFWGISRHKETSLRVVENTGLDYTPEHIQSYFFAVRKNLFCSECFEQYWNELGDIVTYNDAVVRHEIRFTRYFSEKGYKWSTYLKPSWMEKYHEYVMISHPVECITEYGCPFVKRRALLNSFFPRMFPYGQSRENDLIRYLKNNTKYPVEYIIRDLCKNERVRDIENALSRTLILEENVSVADDVLTVFYLDKPDYLDVFFEIAGKNRNSVVFCNESLSGETEKYNSCADVKFVNKEKVIGSVLSFAQRRREKYIFFTSNQFFDNCSNDLLDDNYRAAVEETYISYKISSKLGEIEQYLDENQDVCAVVGCPSYWNALLIKREKTKSIDVDCSAHLTAKYVFFAQREDFISGLIKIIESSMDEFCYIPSLIFKEKKKEIAIAFSKEEAGSGLRYILPIQEQNVKDAQTIQRFDHARAFAEDFLTTCKFKDRVWFLLLAVLPSYRKKLLRHFDKYLKKDVENDE